MLNINVSDHEYQKKLNKQRAVTKKRVSDFQIKLLRARSAVNIDNSMLYFLDEIKQLLNIDADVKNIESIFEAINRSKERNRAAAMLLIDYKVARELRYKLFADELSIMKAYNAFISSLIKKIEYAITFCV